MEDIPKKEISVLIVEDSPTMRQLVAMSLKKIGNVKITEAGDGVDGLKKISQEKFDVIFIDINMPLLDGLKLVKMIKEDPSSNKIPVVIITTDLSSESKRISESLGVDAYLTKPVQTKTIYSTVKSILKL